MQSRRQLFFLALALGPLACSAVLGIEEIEVQGPGGGSASSASASDSTTLSSASTVAASSSVGTSTAGASSSGSGGACPGAGPTIAGTDHPINVIAPGSEKTSSVDLTKGHVIQALTPHCNGPGFDRFDGVGTQSGGFTIDGAPDGPYFLNLDGVYYWISDRSVKPELGGYVVGRLSPPSVKATAPMSVTFDMTNMDPWDDMDQIQLFSVQGGGTQAVFDEGILPGDDAYDPGFGFTPGMVNLQGTASYLTDFWVPGLLIPADDLWIFQVHHQTSLGHDYTALTRWLRVNGLNLMDGANFQINGAFNGTNPADQVDTTLSFSQSDFEKRAKEAGAGVTLDSAVIGVDAMPAPLDRGTLIGTPDVLIAFEPIGAPDWSSVPVSYNDPLRGSAPNGWSEFVFASVSYHVDYLLPGTTLPFSSRVSIGIIDAPSAFAGAAPVPAPLSVAINATVDGKPFSSDVMLGSVSPTLSWSPPATSMPGVPIVYIVSVRRLYASNMRTKSEATATFLTDQTSLTIPDALLGSGETYAVTLRAHQSVGYQLQKFPARRPFPAADATILSGKLRAP